MNAALPRQWQTLIERPLSFVRQQALAESLQQPLTTEQMAALCQLPRFASRMEQRLMEHFRLQPLGRIAAPADADVKVLLLTQAQLAQLPTLCGAVWHGATLSREIRGEVVGHYRQALGTQAMQLALALRHMAGAADLLRTPDELVAAIERDGAACMNAWLGAQPEPLRDWLRLRLDFSDLPAAVDVRQARLVCSVAAEIGASAGDNEGETHE
jgi:hypothetical protein